MPSLPTTPTRSTNNYPTTPTPQPSYPSLSAPLTPPSSLPRSFTTPSTSWDTPIYSTHAHANLPPSPSPSYETSKPYRWDAPIPRSTMGMSVFNPSNRTNLLTDLVTLFGTPSSPSSPASSPSKSKKINFALFPSRPSVNKRAISAPVGMSFEHKSSGVGMVVLGREGREPQGLEEMGEGLMSARSSYSDGSRKSSGHSYTTSESSFTSSSISPYASTFSTSHGPITPPTPSRARGTPESTTTFGHPSPAKQKSRKLRKQRSRSWENGGMEGWVREGEVSDEDEGAWGELEVDVEEGGRGGRWGENWV